MPFKSAAMSDEKYQENLSYIADPEVRMAYAHMRRLAEGSGFSIEFVERAAAGTMKLMKPELGREAYLFSVDRARRHLTFYVRRHATRRWPDLMAQPLRGGEVQRDNEQVYFKITARDEIDRVWSWLKPHVEGL